MVANTVRSLSASITWDFRLTQQGMMSRYGRLGNLFYKQFLPGGIEVGEIHPPRQISGVLYGLARREYDRLNDI